jgi:flagellar biosynthesis/type III secretory pathway M-ring protein FliF/YscJ
MPPQIQALLQNRNALIGIGGGVLLLLLIVGFVIFGGAGKSLPKGGGPLEASQRGLATVESLGKAIEIQALLAREGIRLDKEEADGGKISLKFNAEATKEDRDRALITMVQSGLMDKNVGLEAFDKGDLTASREEKRIKLVRSQQGELARLIRKIPPIEEATVSLSIPEPTMFKSDQKPLSVSVQVTLPNAERLERNKVRSIINLVVGSIQGLDAQHVALADTNGNTYNSVVQGGAELNDQLQEQDQYMKEKVSSQLDKLVGPGNYVVTISTLLRQASKETMTQSYDPSQSVVSSKQSFSEKLNSPSGSSKPGAAGPSSTMLPPAYTGKTLNAMLPPTANDMFNHNTSVTPATPRTPAIVVNGVVPGSLEGTSLTTTNTDSSSNNGRGYSRIGTELGYSTGKTQTVETDLPGMIEDISVAVSIDRSHFPTSMSVDDLKALVAHAANPKINPQEVTVVKTDFQHPQTSASAENGNSLSAPSGSGNVAGPGNSGSGFSGMNLIGNTTTGGNSSNTVNWTLLGAGAAILLSLTMVFLSLMSGRSAANKDTQEVQQTRRDLEQLRQFTVQQQDVIQQSQEQMQAQNERLLETQQQLQQIANAQPVAGILPVTQGIQPGLSIPTHQAVLPNLAGGTLTPQPGNMLTGGNDETQSTHVVIPSVATMLGTDAAVVAKSNDDALSQRLGASLQALSATLAQDTESSGTDLSQPLKNWLNS